MDIDVVKTSNPMATVVIIGDVTSRRLTEAFMQELLEEGIAKVVETMETEPEMAREALQTMHYQLIKAKSIQLSEMAQTILTQHHDGACTDQRYECMRCKVERLIGISTLPDIEPPTAQRINLAFAKFTSVDNIVEYLRSTDQSAYDIVVAHINNLNANR